MIARLTQDGKGFTIDGSLAWTMVSGLIVVAFWFGSELQDIKRSLVASQEANKAFSAAWEAQVADVADYRRDTDVRLRALEAARAGNDERLTNALNLLTRIDARLERIETNSQESGGR
jgi:hypothetical protein